MQIVKFLRKQAYTILHARNYLHSLKFFRERYQWFHKRFPFTWLDDKYFLEYYFFWKLGYRLNLKNPRTINEKLNWMKLYDRNPFYTQISDKWMCRDYVRRTIGPRYLKPLLGVYEAVEEISWQKLPEKFVIKVNHGSGWNIICNDKTTFDKGKAEETLRQWLAQDYYWKIREWQYKGMKPKIIIEPLLEGDLKYGLIEYQVYCFDGDAKFVQVDIDCNCAHSRLFLTPDWKKMPFTIVRFPTFDGIFPRPQNFDEALSIAEKLTEGMPFCRVDLHFVEQNIFISEMTLMPAGGFMTFKPREYDLILGDSINL